MMPWSAHVTVATVIQRDGRFLLVEEHPKDQIHDVIYAVYNQPAGHVEAGETLIEAALRETLEETAWQVNITHLLGMYTYTPPNLPDKTYFRFCFLADAVQETDRPLDQDIIRAVWLTAEELALSARARSPLVMRCVQDALAGQRYPLDVIYEHSSFISHLEA